MGKLKARVNFEEVTQSSQEKNVKRNTGIIAVSSFLISVAIIGLGIGYSSYIAIPIGVLHLLINAVFVYGWCLRKSSYYVPFLCVNWLMNLLYIAFGVFYVLHLSGTLTLPFAQTHGLWLLILPFCFIGHLLVSLMVTCDYCYIGKNKGGDAVDV